MYTVSNSEAESVVATDYFHRDQLASWRHHRGLTLIIADFGLLVNTQVSQQRVCKLI